MRISDWSSDVCSSDLAILAFGWAAWAPASAMRRFGMDAAEIGPLFAVVLIAANLPGFLCSGWICDRWFAKGRTDAHLRYYVRSEEHTSELQSLMRNSYAVFCWKKKNKTN